MHIKVVVHSGKSMGVNVGMSAGLNMGMWAGLNVGVSVGVVVCFLSDCSLVWCKFECW